jgi:hypothetical protein
MLILPDRLTVTLVPSSPELDVAGLLLALDIRVQGRYYWGSLLGLSDAAGLAEITGDALARQFTQDRTLFPMDYKVPLDRCDAEVRIRLEGGVAFTRAREQAVNAALVSAIAREAWKGARNAAVAPAEIGACLDAMAPRNLALTLGAVQAVA